MAALFSIAGSPSAASRSAALCQYANQYANAHGISSDLLIVRDLDPQDLIYGRFDGGSLQPAFAKVAQAKGIIVATPVYKAAYSGVLKSFLDLLPANALAEKVVLPIASGGSPAHSLVLDYALKPVLAALGAGQMLPGSYLMDAQYSHDQGQNVQFVDQEAQTRFHAALDQLLSLITG